MSLSTNLLKAGVAFATAFVLVTFQGAAPAWASTVTFSFDTLLSGKSPGGAAPWITATFTDIAPNTIELTLNAVDLTRGEFLGRDGFYFNVGPFVPHLRASFVSGQNGNLRFRKNGFNANGDGRFDALLSFAQTGHNRLTQGETSVWKIHGRGLSTADILDLTAGTGKEPEGLYVASHLLGGPTGKRGDWLTDTPPSDLDTLTDGGNTSSDGGDAPSAVPLPPALLLFGSGLAALGLRSRWRLAKENSQSA